MGLKNRAVLETTTPNKNPLHPNHSIKEESIVHIIPHNLICDDCKKLESISARMKCTHLMQTNDNPFKEVDFLHNIANSKSRKEQLNSMAEHKGVVMEVLSRGYNKKHLLRWFDETHVWKPLRLALANNRLQLISIDPNAGGITCDTGIYAGEYDWVTQNHICTGIDARSTKNHGEFDSYILEYIELYDNVIRRHNADIPICVVVESQGPYDGSRIFDALNDVRSRNPTAFPNVHVLGDIRKQYDKTGHDISRWGVSVRDTDQREMHRYFLECLTKDRLRYHKRLVTTSPDENGREIMISELQEQMGRYRAPVTGENMGYNTNGKVRGDSYGAKMPGMKDDISDALHQYFEWLRRIFWDRRYWPQLKNMGIDLQFIREQA